MIKSFADHDMERLFRRKRIKRLGSDIEGTALRKLRMLDAAATLDDVKIPPGNRSEKLRGDLGDGMASSTLLPIHPGEVLSEEFLGPMGISQYRLAKDISVSPRRINEIVHGKRSVTADTALRLSRHFGTSDRFWLNLQMSYDLDVERDKLGDRLATEVLTRAG